MKDIKGIVFDMDGVIVDSEPLYYRVDKSVMRDFGVILKSEDLDPYVGVVTEKVWTDLIDKFDLKVTLDEVLDKILIYREKYFVKENFIHVEGTSDLIKYLSKREYKIGLASSSPQWFIDRVLEAFELREYFDSVICGENLKRSKPAPDIYIKAADSIGLNPENCIAVEDANSGVNAAKSAGMYTVGYVNPNSGNQDLSKADLIVHSINDIRKSLPFL